MQERSDGGPGAEPVMGVAAGRLGHSPGSSTERNDAVPWALWLVIAGLGVVAAVLLVPAAGVAAVALPAVGTLDAAGFAMLLPALAMLVVPVLFVALGHGLYRGSRVARGLSFVALGSVLAVASQLSAVSGGAAVVIVLASIALSVVLALAPSVRAFFAGPWSTGSSLPTSVEVARIVLIVYSAQAALAAVVLLASALGSSAGLAVVGIMAATLAVGGFIATSLIAERRQSGRALTSFLLGVDTLMLIGMTAQAGAVDSSLASALILHLAAVGALWVPTDARRFFGDAPLAAIDSLHKQMIELSSVGRSVSAAPPPSPTDPARATPTGPRPHGPIPAPVQLGGPAFTSAPRQVGPGVIAGSAAAIGRQGDDTDAPTEQFAIPSQRTGRHARPQSETAGAANLTACTTCAGDVTTGWAYCPGCGAPISSAAPELRS